MQEEEQHDSSNELSGGKRRGQKDLYFITKKAQQQVNRMKNKFQKVEYQNAVDLAKTEKNIKEHIFFNGGEQ